MLVRLVLVGLGVVFAMSACPGPDDGDKPAARPSGSPFVEFPVKLEASPLPLPPEEQPQPEPKPTDGQFIYRSVSRQVEWGQPYRFSIFVHCGIDPLVDFDGSFWDVEESAVGPFFRRYFRSERASANRIFGTMTIVPPGDAALFRSRNRADLPFHRHPEETKVAGVCF